MHRNSLQIQLAPEIDSGYDVSAQKVIHVFNSKDHLDTHEKLA